MTGYDEVESGAAVEREPGPTRRGSRMMPLMGGRAARLRVELRRLHYGRRPRDVAFQGALLGLDVVTLGYFVATTFFPDAPWIGWVDLVLGLLLLLDFAGRLLSYRRPVRYLETFAALTDIVVILSLLSSALTQSLAFLRVLRLLRAYQILDRLGRLYPRIELHQQLIGAILNLAVFVLMTSSLVYVSQRHLNPKITNFLDALYFTVTTLSTTGFGDVTLEGPSGRLLAIAMMIIGITLFLRLAQAVFRPAKVRHACPDCGLERHELDAVHCKACGRMLNIKDEGQ